MATYLPGVTPYIPQLQPFKPDFNFYSGQLKMRQTAHDAGRDKLSTLYGSLLNSPMLRDKNVAERDEFFKIIDQDIKKMATMDLSKAINVDSAANIFNQLTDNKNIVKDMVWTKNWQKQKQRGEGLKTCLDEEKCGGTWWEGGDQLLNYEAEEFKNATDSEAMNMKKAEYVPQQNVMKKAIKLAKEADLNVTLDHKSGSYVVTTKNGPNLVRPLSDLFSGVLGNDPKIMNYFKGKAKLERKNWVTSKTSEYGSKEQAEQIYLEKMNGILDAQYAKALAKLERDQETTGKIKKEKEEEIKANGTTKQSPLAASYREIVQEEARLNGTAQVTKTAQDQTSLSKKVAGSRSAEAIDNAMAFSYLQTEINEAAMTLANKNFEVSREADKFDLERIKHNNRMIIESIKAIGKENKRIKKEQKKAREQELAEKGTPEYQNQDMKSSKEENPEAKGLKQEGSENLVDQTLYQEAKHQTYANDLAGDQRVILNKIIKLTSGQAAGGDTQAQADYVQYAKEILTMQKTSAQVSDTQKTEAIKALTLIDEAEKGKKSIEELYKVISTKYDITQMVIDAENTGQGQHKIDSEGVDVLYNKVLVPRMKSEATDTVRTYLAPIWAHSLEARLHIKRVDESLARTSKWRQNAVIEAVNKHSPGGSHHATSKYYPSKKNRDDYEEAWGDDVGRYKYTNRHLKDLEMYKHVIGPDGLKRDADAFSSAWARAQNKDKDWSKKETYTDKDVLASKKEALDRYNTKVDNTDWAFMRMFSDGSVYSFMDGFNSFHADQVEMDGEYNPNFKPGSGVKQATPKPFWIDSQYFRNQKNIDFVSFLKEAMESGETKYASHAPGATIPKSSSDAYKKLVKRFYDDWVTTSKKDNRPTADVIYQGIAGGNEDWSAVHIKLPMTYTGRHKGNATNPGIMRNQKFIEETGFTIYLKNARKNNWHRASTKTVFDWEIDHAGFINIDIYDAVYTKKFKITKVQGGDFEITGQLMIGYDEKGEKEYKSIHKKYDGSIPVQNIVRAWEKVLHEKAISLKRKVTEYNDKHGIKNPKEAVK